MLDQNGSPVGTLKKRSEFLSNVFNQSVVITLGSENIFIESFCIMSALQHSSSAEVELKVQSQMQSVGANTHLYLTFTRNIMTFGEPFPWS